MTTYVHNVSHPHHVSMLQIWSTLLSMDNKWLTSVPKSPVFRRACPSRRAFVENRPSNARLFVILPVFLWFSAHSERYWAIWQTGQQRSEPALNHKRTTKSQKLEFRPSLRPSNARIFAKKTPVWRIGYTEKESEKTPKKYTSMSEESGGNFKFMNAMNTYVLK